MKHPTTLVIGAGASVCMGYPTGLSLRQMIIQNIVGSYAEVIKSSDSQITQADLLAFEDAFRESQMYSIDAFLARRSEFANIGKRAIAAALLSCEERNRQLVCPIEHHWLQYFFNECVVATRWEALSFENIRVVSFNYDRVFEHFLARALAASYGKSLAECFDRLKSLKIIHVYGTLGPCFLDVSDYFEYGSGVTAKNIDIVANSIRVIPEGRVEDTTLVQAREHLLWADRIAFLGFGFDRTNLALLRSIETCAPGVQRPQGYQIRKIIGSRFGMTNAEARTAVWRIVGKTNLNNDIQSNFYDGDCISTLRETLVLTSD